MADNKYVYSFGRGKAEGHGKMKDILGGKGAGLAEMTNAGLPVPPGFTISTAACGIYYQNNRSLPKEFMDQIMTALAGLEAVTGKQLGSTAEPLLVSVRSGAKFSMPGMMDTIPRPATRGSPTTATAGSSRCSPTSFWVCRSTTSSESSTTSRKPGR